MFKLDNIMNNDTVRQFITVINLLNAKRQMGLINNINVNFVYPQEFLSKEGTEYEFRKSNYGDTAWNVFLDRIQTFYLAKVGFLRNKTMNLGESLNGDIIIGDRVKQPVYSLGKVEFDVLSGFPGSEYDIAFVDEDYFAPTKFKIISRYQGFSLASAACRLHNLSNRRSGMANHYTSILEKLFPGGSELLVVDDEDDRLSNMVRYLAEWSVDIEDLNLDIFISNIAVTFKFRCRKDSSLNCNFSIIHGFVGMTDYPSSNGKPQPICTVDRRIVGRSMDFIFFVIRNLHIAELLLSKEDKTNEY